MSINQFKNELRTYVEDWCAGRGQNAEDGKSRGMAFEEFVFGILVERFEFDGASAEENIFTTNERGFDIVLPPSGNSNQFIVCQCQMGGLGKKTKPTLDRDKMSGWFHRLSDIIEENWIKDQSFSLELRNLLLDLKNHIENYKSVKWLYVTNNAKHENSGNDLKSISHSAKYDELYPHVETEIIAIEELTDLYMEVQKVETSIPEQIQFLHGEGKGIFDSSGNPFFVGLISAKEVTEWYKTHKESLFNQNIRTLLTKNRINSEMALTIKKEPKKFRHFNNGISAICDKLEYDNSDRKIIATKFNVINGAQTVGTLFAERNSTSISDVEVLIRITQVKYTSPLSTDITRFNNTQNAVSAPDFKSNDRIQIWLEKEFEKFRKPEYFEKLVYRRKRPYKRGKSNEIVLNITDFAKIRRSFILSSAEQNSDPNEAWKSESEGGCYEKIFPSSGILDNKEFLYFNFIFNIYLKLGEKIKETKKQNGEKQNGEKQKSLTRMLLLGVEGFDRFWKEYATDFPNHDSIEKGQAAHADVFNKYWRIFYSVLIEIYDEEINPSSTMTAHSFVRSRVLTEKVITKTLRLYKTARDINKTE